MRDSYGWRAVLVVAALALGCKAVLAQIGPRYVLELPEAAAAKAASTTGTAQAGAAAAASQGRLQLVGAGLSLLRFQGLSLLVVAADAAVFSAEAVRDWPDADLLLVTPAAAGHYRGLAPLAALKPMPVIVAEQASEPAMPATAAGITSALAPATATAAASTAAAPRYYPMQSWDALYLRKGKARLRVTAMPGPPATAAVAGFMLEVGNGRASYRLYVSCAMPADEEIGGLFQRLPGADLALLPERGGPQLLAPLDAAPSARRTTSAARVSGKLSALTADGYAFMPLKR